MTPIIEEVADKLGDSVTVGKIDATLATVTANDFGVKSYPTIKYYKDGRYGDYEGNKSYAGIAHFISRIQGALTVNTE